MSDFYDEVYGPESIVFQGTPHGRIQWKGTDVCMDIVCVCGADAHVDAIFFYHYQCLACGRKFAVGTRVALIELNAEQIAHAERGIGFTTGEP